MARFGNHVSQPAAGYDEDPENQRAGIHRPLDGADLG
jgi:hypothetical protein